jgi:hypothetical protein
VSLKNGNKRIFLERFDSKISLDFRENSRSKEFNIGGEASKFFESRF